MILIHIQELVFIDILEKGELALIGHALGVGAVSTSAVVTIAVSVVLNSVSVVLICVVDVGTMFVCVSGVVFV